MINLPQEIWNSIWINCDNEHVIKEWFEIESAYLEKGRHYHNLDHISKMLASSIHYKSGINDIKTLQLAIFYHDIIYSVKRKDNEEKSAQAAVKSLSILNYPESLIEKCKEYIVSTKNHINLLNNNDLNYLLDFDLEILATSWAEYHQYTQQIRKEYHIYPDIIYKAGRKKVLKHFLKLSNIYRTIEYKDKFESLAKQNIMLELEMLN